MALPGSVPDMKMRLGTPLGDVMFVSARVPTAVALLSGTPEVGFIPD